MGYPYIEARSRAIKAIAKHEVHIEHDEGVFRSILFKAPGTSNYHFRLVTWPGHLAISGDIGDFIFAREHDMFGWFATDHDWAAMPLKINPVYWGQKVQAASKMSIRDGSNGVSEIKTDVEAVRRAMVAWFRGIYLSEWDAVYSSSNDECYRMRGWAELRDFLETDIYEDAPVAETIRMIDGFSLSGHMFKDGDTRRYETDYSDYGDFARSEYTNTFLMCCEAILWGIKRYAQTKEGRASADVTRAVLAGRR